MVNNSLTYFELFNKTLLELNWRKLTTFENINKTEHLRVLDCLNRTNDEVLSALDWDFLNEIADFELAANTIKISQMPEGRILKITENACVYRFEPDFDKFLKNYCKNDLSSSEIASGALENSTFSSCESLVYSQFGGEIYFAPRSSLRQLKIFYKSNYHAKNHEGQKKLSMSAFDDTSRMPMPWAEGILVYGAALKVKCNPAFAKFNYWHSMYLTTLASMRQNHGATLESTPKLKIGRKNCTF